MLTALDVKGPVVAFEIDIDRIPAAPGQDGPGRPLLKVSPFQPIERDFAFVVAADTPAEKLVRAAKARTRR